MLLELLVLLCSALPLLVGLYAVRTLKKNNRSDSDDPPPPPAPEPPRPSLPVAPTQRLRRPSDRAPLPSARSRPQRHRRPTLQ